MPKAPKSGFYAVSKGHVPGIYMTWDECEKQVSGFPGAKYKKFARAAEAEAFVNESRSGSSTTAQESSSMSIGRKSNATAINNKPSSKDVAVEAGWEIVYCDGACKGNGKAGSVAGIGVWWGVNDPRNLFERCPGDQTNNRAELIAIIRILETTPSSFKPLLIKTDSKYSISCVDIWIHNWIKRGWKTAGGLPVKNKPVIQYLYHLLNLRAQKGQKVRLQHVKGHAGEEGNEGADRLANIGALQRSIPERDWENLMKKAGSNDTTSDGSGTVPFEVDIGEGELLSDAELKQMELDDNFD